MPNNTNGGGSGAMTALLAILVIAIVGFGIWYVMNDRQEDQEGGAGLEINLGNTDEQ